MSYTAKLKMRAAFMGLLIVLGVVSIFIGLSPQGAISDFSRGYFSGLGFSLTVVGTFTLVRLGLVLKNEEKLRAKRIEEEDERNTFLNLFSSHIAYLVVLVGLFIATLYYAFHSEAILHVLACAVMVTGLVKAVSYIIVKKHM